jgi:transcriptional regulator with XRE-family HTH domain
VARQATKNPGASIRKLRINQILSQAELAERAGLNTVTLSHIERGANTTVETLEKLAEALSVNVAELFDERAVHRDDVPQALRRQMAYFSVAVGEVYASLAQQVQQLLIDTQAESEKLIAEHRESMRHQTVAARRASAVRLGRSPNP